MTKIALNAPPFSRRQWQLCPRKIVIILEAYLSGKGILENARDRFFQ
jgi:hypothetical protein